MVERRAMMSVKKNELLIECLWILESNSGICIFEQNYVDITKDNVSIDIITSFFSAILSIAEESFVDEIEYIKFSRRKIFFEFVENLLFIISVKDVNAGEEQIKMIIDKIAHKFRSKYQSVIPHFGGNISQFNDFSVDLEEIVKEKPIPLRILQVEQVKDNFKKFISKQLELYKKRKAMFDKIIKKVKKEFLESYKYFNTM